MKKWFVVAVSSLLLVSVNTHALTVAEECQKKSMSAYDRGTNEAEKQRLGAEAASECFKEMGDSLKKSGDASSASSGGSVGAILLLLAIGGFFAYKFIAKRDEPYSASQIRDMREEARELFKVEMTDSKNMRKYKEKLLAESDNMFSLALKGELPITKSTFNMSDGAADARKRISEFRESQSKAKADYEEALASSIEVRDSVNNILSMPMIDEDNSEERDRRAFMTRLLAETDLEIEKWKDAIALC